MNVNTNLHDLLIIYAITSLNVRYMPQNFLKVQDTIKLYAKIYSKSIDRALKKIYYKETQTNFQKLNQISIDKKQGNRKKRK